MDLLPFRPNPDWIKTNLQHNINVAKLQHFLSVCMKHEPDKLFYLYQFQVWGHFGQVFTKILASLVLTTVCGKDICITDQSGSLFLCGFLLEHFFFLPSLSLNTVVLSNMTSCWAETNKDELVTQNREKFLKKADFLVSVRCTVLS